MKNYGVTFGTFKVYEYPTGNDMPDSRRLAGDPKNSSVFDIDREKLKKNISESDHGKALIKHIGKPSTKDRFKYFRNIDKAGLEKAAEFVHKFGENNPRKVATAVSDPSFDVWESVVKGERRRLLLRTDPGGEPGDLIRAPTDEDNKAADQLPARAKSGGDKKTADASDMHAPANIPSISLLAFEDASASLPGRRLPDGMADEGEVSGNTSRNRLSIAGTPDDHGRSKRFSDSSLSSISSASSVVLDLFGSSHESGAIDHRRLSADSNSGSTFDRIKRRLSISSNASSSSDRSWSIPFQGREEKLKHGLKKLFNKDFMDDVYIATELGKGFINKQRNRSFSANLTAFQEEAKSSFTLLANDFDVVEKHLKANNVAILQSIAGKGAFARAALALESFKTDLPASRDSEFNALVDKLGNVFGKMLNRPVEDLVPADLHGSKELLVAMAQFQQCFARFNEKYECASQSQCDQNEDTDAKIERLAQTLAGFAGVIDKTDKLVKHSGSTPVFSPSEFLADLRELSKFAKPFSRDNPMLHSYANDLSRFADLYSGKEVMGPDEAKPVIDIASLWASVDAACMAAEQLCSMTKLSDMAKRLSEKEITQRVIDGQLQSLRLSDFANPAVFSASRPFEDSEIQSLKELCRELGELCNSELAVDSLRDRNWF